MFDTKTLNDSQSRVVMTPANKHILCVAGPGSGKTHTMTYRIGYLAQERNVLPSRIRAVTFSWSAAKEMRSRLHSLDAALHTVEASTIHGLCRSIIHETQGATTEGGDFSSFVEDNPKFKDKKPQKAVSEAVGKVLERMQPETLKQIVRELKIKATSTARDIAKKLLAISERGDPKEQLGTYIQHQKTKAHCTEYIPDAKLPTFSYKFASRVLRLPKKLRANPIAFYQSVYEQYCKILTEWKLLDFTDQIIYAHLGLLDCTESTRKHLQSGWDILAVDEFQDVDAIQFEVFCLLCAGNTKLNAVGDPDQAIYGFRGGDASFISDFKGYFPDAEVLKLDTNYRSNTEIIDVAYSAVENIEQPHRAKGESSNGIGGTVGFAEVKKIGDFSTGSTGVLAWTNKTLNEISRDLAWNGVACSVNTRWRSYLNVPIASYRVVYQTLQSLKMVTDEIDFDREAFLKYAQDMKDIGKTVMNVEGSTLTELRRDLRVAGYVRFLRSLRKLKIPDKVRAIADSDYFPAIKPEESAVLATFNFSDTYETARQKVKIKLYTIHRVKGLEFDTVFVQTEDFAKPFADENPDESMRLLFVGLSRAKQNLFLLGEKNKRNAIVSPVVRAINAIQSTQCKEERKEYQTKGPKAKLQSAYTKDDYCRHFNGESYNYEIELDLKYTLREVYEAARIAHENRMTGLKRGIPAICKAFLDTL